MAWNYNPYHSPPYQAPYMPLPQQAPSMQVVRVNGRGGADAFAMGPNSSALLLDESGTLVWAVTTDGAGYKTISPYDITPHHDAPAPDFSSLESRIKRLEGFMNELSGDIATVDERKSAASAGPKSDGNAPKR